MTSVFVECMKKIQINILCLFFSVLKNICFLWDCLPGCEFVFLDNCFAEELEEMKRHIPTFDTGIKSVSVGSVGSHEKCAISPFSVNQNKTLKSRKINICFLWDCLPGCEFVFLDNCFAEELEEMKRHIPTFHTGINSVSVGSVGAHENLDIFFLFFWMISIYTALKKQPYFHS